jgi:hypothetical protein
MTIEIRRWLSIVEHRDFEQGRRAATPLRKVAAVAIVANPFAGRYVQDLSGAIAESVEVGALLANIAVAAMDGLPIQSYGKGGVVGTAGEQEHANAMLTTVFATPLRDAIGGAAAWIPSFTKLAAAGSSIDVPLAHKDALYVRSHYDGMTVTLPSDAPGPDEVALIVVVANRGRLEARVGGLDAAAIIGKDGLH